MHQANSTTEFRLVLDVVPWHFSDRPTPKEIGSREHPEPWYAYFQACLSGAGLRRVEPIAKGSFFVPVSDLLEHELLEILVIRHLRDLDVAGFTDNEGPSEEATALDGGIAILHDGSGRIEPSCCGCLEDLSHWREALESSEPRGRFWIGHPMLEFEKEDGVMTLRETVEYPSEKAALLNGVRLPIERAIAELGRVVEEREKLKRALSSLTAHDARMQAIPNLVPCLIGVRGR